MTAIAYRDGILAADTQDFYGNLRLGISEKIARRKDGALAGAAGRAELCEQFLTAFRNGKGFPVEFDAPPEGRDDEDGGFCALVVEPCGAVWFHAEHGGHKILHAPWFVIGSASDFLAGALAAGATAEDAVRLATRLYMTCGGDVQMLSLDPLRLPPRGP